MENSAHHDNARCRVSLKVGFLNGDVGLPAPPPDDFDRHGRCAAGQKDSIDTGKSAVAGEFSGLEEAD
eukprot:gene19010-biopygen3978